MALARPSTRGPTLKRWRWSFIRPGKPMGNGHIENFNGKVRDECLTLPLVCEHGGRRQKSAEWRCECNEARPHSSLRQLPRRFCQAKHLFRQDISPSTLTGSAQLGITLTVIARHKPRQASS